MALFLSIDTEIEWINDIAEVPVLGGLFAGIFIFVPAVAMSFCLYAIIPFLHNDVGFTKAMLVLLPAWMVLVVISLVKGYLMIAGIDDGQ